MNRNYKLSHFSSFETFISICACVLAFQRERETRGREKELTTKEKIREKTETDIKSHSGELVEHEAEMALLPLLAE